MRLDTLAAPNGDARLSSPQFAWKRNWWVILLLALASVHTAQCIFFDNYSLMDLVSYENGKEMMPFQGRISMMPILRLVHGSPFVTQLGVDLSQTQGEFHHVMIEEYTPEKVACYTVGMLSILWMVWLTGNFGWRRFRDLWWFPPALFLAVLYASYAARADQNLWYPYDLPHAALFTTGLFALLSGAFLPLAVAFVLDCFTRETAVYLIPCILAVGYARKDLKTYGLLAGGLSIFWLPVYLLIKHHFHANPSDVGLHYHQNAHVFLQPKHLPQVASAVGFLALPIFVWRRLLDNAERAILLGAIPGVMLSGLLGIWFETRVWSEWNAVAACLASVIFVRYLDNRRQEVEGVSAVSAPS